MAVTIRIQSEPFDTGAEIAGLSAGRDDVGAVASFTGYVRADDGLSEMRLEHYPGMTEREIARHVAEASSRWPLLGVTVIHRVGALKPGEPIVLVAVASSHRAAAFSACEFLMDYLKTEAPFWKEETVGGTRRWVEAKQSDEVAKTRW